MPLLTIIIGVAVLVKSSDIIIDKIILAGHSLSIKDVVIGTLILSITTSLPELSIMGLSLVQNAGEISFGDVFGSNITNIGLALGIAIFVGAQKKPIIIENKNIKEILNYLGMALLITVLALAILSFKNILIGPILLLCFAGYVFFSFKKGKEKLEHNKSKLKIKDMVMLLVGIILLIISAKITVDNTIILSQIAGLHKSFIGATIIALGTSLPEIIFGYETIKKGNPVLMLGNMIGSSIINISLVLGLLAILSNLIINVPIMIILNIYSLLLLGELIYFIRVRKKLDKTAGLILIFTYILYVVVISSAEIIGLN